MALCQQHQLRLQHNYCQGCQQQSLSCQQCVLSHNGLPHSLLTEHTINDLTNLTKKNKLRLIITRYFTNKKKEMEAQLSQYYQQLMSFVDCYPQEDELQQFVSKFVRDLEQPTWTTCEQLHQLLQKIEEISRRQPNPESEANEQEKMRLFERFEQYSIEFKMNTNHAVKEMKKKIEGALRIDVREVKVKRHMFSDSAILDISHSKMIEKFFRNKIKCADLLFRASEHEYCAEKFHIKCDGIRNTLVVLKNEFKKIVGGFSPLAWESNLGYLMDIGRETFIFSLTLGQKMELQGKYGIWNSASYGPAFGYGNYGHDLCISDRADKRKASYAEFPLSFNNHNNYTNSQQTWQLFCGQKKGNNFNVEEWEVWRLEFQEK